MHRRYHFAYLAVILTVFALILLSFIFTEPMPESQTYYIIEPISITSANEYEREFLFDVSSPDIYKNDFAFFAKHQYIKIYSDDELIYSYDYDGDIWGHTTGAAWIFIDIPYEASELKVVLTAAYDLAKDDIPSFFIGDRLGIFQDIYKNSIPTLFISLLILIFGIILIIYWFFLVHRFHIDKSLFYLGFLSALIGIYLLNETDAAIIGLHRRTACIQITYLILMTLSPTGIIFIKEFLGTVENRIWKLLCIASLIEFLVCVALQFFNIYDLRETLFITHLIILLTGIYLTATLIIKLCQHDYSSMLRASLLGVVILVVSVLLNLIMYYADTSVSDTSIITRLGFLLFILILSREAARSSLELMKKGRQTEVYQKLAIKDMLTGLNNRNAYMSDINALTSYHDIMIISFDLNDLKKCNDTLGHGEGDLYLLNAARILREVFSPYGLCYRIGGDEFCALIKNASQCPIGHLTAILETKEKQFNVDHPHYNMHISFGYAIYNHMLDADLEQTRNRADAIMYENKRRSKGKNEHLHS